MKTRTRRLLIEVATGIAVAATAALMLAPAAASAQSGKPSFGFGIQIGPDGKPSVSIGIGTPHDDQVCFYERSRFRGDSFCMDPGSAIRDLGDWTDAIGSMENPGGLRVTLCTDTRFRGRCATYTTDARSLGGFDGNVASIRIR